jgi:hypothetical protein
MILTPRDWQQIAQGEALTLAGMPEAHTKMVEAKRYGALADEIDRLRGMVGGHDDLSQALIDRLENLEVQAVREIVPGWVGIPTVEWDSIMGPNAPHEGRTAALSPGVPLDAVVGRQNVKRSDDG